MALAKFVHIAKKATFTAALQTEHANSIVFIQDTCEIFTHGTFYGLPTDMRNKITSLETALNALKYFSKVSDGTNTAAANAKDSIIKFTGAGDVDVTVSADGVKVDGTTIKNAAAAAQTAADNAQDAADAAQTDIDTHVAKKDNPHEVTKAQVGLGNVENKTVAQILASAALTGTPTAPTAAAGTNTTQVATTAFVKAAVDTLGNAVAAALRYVGTIGTGGDITALPASHKIGDVYIVKTGGTYAGQVCEVGDMIICSKTGSTAADGDWQVIQANINGAITGAVDMTADQVIVGGGSKTAKPLAAGSNGQVLTMVSGKPAWTALPAAPTVAAGTDGSFTYNGTKISIGKPATAGTADKVAQTMVVKLNGGTTEGTNMFTFNGAAAKSVNITAASIGAAATSHNQASSTINACTGYAKAASYSAPAASDSLNTVLGKLAAGVEELTWVEL